MLLRIIGDHGAIDSVDGIVIFGAAYPELHLVFQPPIVPVLLHLYIGGLGLADTGVFQRGGLGRFCAHILGARATSAGTAVIRRPVGLPLLLQYRAVGGGDSIVVLGGIHPELHFVFQPAIIPVLLDPQPADLALRHAGMFQRRLLGLLLANITGAAAGFRPGTAALPAVQNILLAAQNFSCPSVDMVLKLSPGCLKLHLIVGYAVVQLRIYIGHHRAHRHRARIFLRSDERRLFSNRHRGGADLGQVLQLLHRELGQLFKL